MDWVISGQDREKWRVSVRTVTVLGVQKVLD